jgi:hypothetical protein
LFSTFVDAYAENDDMNMIDDRFSNFSMRKRTDGGAATPDGIVVDATTTDVAAFPDVVRTVRGAILGRSRRL